MEWTRSLKKAIDYMEEHLLEEIGTGDIANAVYMSPFYFQKGFKIVTGYSVGEYIRNRRLYLAGLEVIAGQEKVIDLAYKYGYDTPESFTKAFARFHGLSPIQLREKPHRIKTFLPLRIEVIIRGGDKMDYVVKKMSSMKMIGFAKEFSFETSYQEIPRFWDEICHKYAAPMMATGKAVNSLQQAVKDYGIGEYGICLDENPEGNKFRYMIAGCYQGGEVPEGLEVVEIPAYEWAQFACVGALPDALQSVNTRIFKEWLPANEEFEIAGHVNLEWYSKGNTQAEDYESAIWIPIKRK